MHGTDRVILLLHSDCGTYGGLHAIFKDDEAAEVEHHRSELRLAEGTVRNAFPHVSIESYFVDFAGVWQLGSGHSPEMRQVSAG